MIEDDSGLFIVQRGSMLPEFSRVASIEERDGRWVLVTGMGADAGIAEVSSTSLTPAWRLPVISNPIAFMTAIVVSSVGLPFSLNER